MLLRGPHSDEAGRRFVAAHRRDDKPRTYPPDLMVLAPSGQLVARLDYAASPEDTVSMLRDVLQRLSLPLPQPASSDPAQVLLQAGERHHAEGDWRAAEEFWRRVVQEHSASPLRHRARYLLRDRDAWPTRALLPQHAAARAKPVLNPFAERHAANLEGIKTDERYEMVAGIPFVFVPPGRFTMGAAEPWLAREAPERQVTIGRGFWLSAWPITIAAFQGRHSVEPGHRDMLPATRVSFAAALRFCADLSRTTGRVFSLPSEAQWEYAARAGGSGVYPWPGDSIDPDCCNYALPRACVVASYEPNGWGLFDMVGNVQEWTADKFRDDAYAITPHEVVDPPGRGPPTPHQQAIDPVIPPSPRVPLVGPIDAGDDDVVSGLERRGKHRLHTRKLHRQHLIPGNR